MHYKITMTYSFYFFNSFIIIINKVNLFTERAFVLLNYHWISKAAFNLKHKCIIFVYKSSAMIEDQKTVYLDRPFLYAIADNNTGLPLFLGIITTL